MAIEGLCLGAHSGPENPKMKSASVWLWVALNVLCCVRDAMECQASKAGVAWHEPTSVFPLCRDVTMDVGAQAAPPTPRAAPLHYIRATYRARSDNAPRSLVRTRVSNLNSRETENSNTPQEAIRSSKHLQLTHSTAGETTQDRSTVHRSA